MISEAIDMFIDDGRARELSEATLKKYRQMFERLAAWCLNQELVWLKQIDAQGLRDFRASWDVAAVSSNKMLERLRAFFHFCHDSGWIDRNPASALRRLIETHEPTMPFTAEEIGRIMAWLEQHRADRTGQPRLWAERLRALVLLLRYTGLRIGDAMMLTPRQVQEGRIMVRQAKTRVAVRLAVPPVVIEALGICHQGDDQPYFGGRGGSAATRAGDMRRELRKMFAGAKVPDGHAHRFRDTLAVELLEKGVPIDRVAQILGHQSTKITEKHYAPWVASRQRLLEAELQKIWSA